MPASGVAAADPVAFKDIETPAGGGGLLAGPTLPGLAAAIGVRLLKRPVRFGKIVIAARHSQVSEVLRRDLDFRIAPVNAGRIQAVNGPFVLGMDRDDRLITERHALYRALADVDLKAIAALAAADADALLDAGAAKGRIDAVEGYARPVAGRTARRLFGVTQPDDRTFHEVARAIFAHTFLNLGGDKAIAARAVKAAGLMHGWLQAEIERRRAGKIDLPDFMGALLRQGLVDDDGVRRTVGGMLVGSIDTTATAVAKIMVVLGRDARLAEAVRRDAHDLVLTRGWCLEALRRWPHNPLVLRQATADTTLDGVAVPAGSQVYVWTQAAMQDAEAFPDPAELRPDRPAGGYLHFGGGMHPCAGRAVNDLQVPMLVSRLLLRGARRVGPVAWAGPFPAKLQIELGSAA